ncbi:MAG TPA: vitamin K epoxide reductase family protein [Anaerolineaceae bacterium]
MKNNLNKKTLATLILASIGLIDSIYLYLIKLTHNPEICLKGIGDCWSVNTSRYSEVYGIPVAVLGALAYLVILILAIFDKQNSFLSKYGIYGIFGISLVGVVYSAYLTYLEIFVIKAICPFCVLSAIFQVAIFVITITRMYSDTAGH